MSLLSTAARTGTPASLARLELRRLISPLKVPYKLALGVVDHFDSLLVAAEAPDGRRGLGEATILTGYTGETPAESWTAACAAAERMAGLDTAAAKAVAGELLARRPFAATALTTAVEMLEGHALLRVEAPREVPLIAIVNETQRAGIEREVAARLAEGYGTLKVKVGFDAERDLARVALIRRLAAGRARLRLDGNQGYDRETAMRFAAALDPAGIELLEQPCAAGDWEAARAVAEVAAVPMMLDESIYGPEDIDKAAALGAARYVKLKLMKAGGLARLAAGLEHIARRGMTPVLGNGVATELGCWMEACVAARGLATAGEMNGFLKPRTGLFRTPLRVRHGRLVLPPDQPELDRDAVEALTRERASFAAPGGG